jgi:hypothetical protein
MIKNNIIVTISHISKIIDFNHNVQQLHMGATYYAMSLTKCVFWLENYSEKLIGQT